jgi:hypothetical protein
VPTMFEPGNTSSAVRWRWVLGVGAGVAALAFALIYLTVTLYATAFSILARGELDRAGLDRFADFMAVRMGYGVRDGFADRSDPTLWWASCLDLDQSIGLATCRGATIGIA